MEMKLFEKILDEQNIFNSIYCLESYVFDKGLLDTKNAVELCDDNGAVTISFANDLELYYALSDKHNVELIENVITSCRQKLKWVFEDKKNLFDVRVYFKLKNYDSEAQKLNFRPMHTARLIDLISMVSILNCLMFDDDFSTGERKLSDLSKLIPHNFYGNIPSTDVQFLFHKWQTKYKEYTEEVIEHCRKYQQNHSFLTEVSLDIKNFFPSVSPKMLYNYIISKLSKNYENETEALGMAVAKLLYFNIRKENIEPWKDCYYPEGTNFDGWDFNMNCGIPQGLPQSYFFGNLCMIEIKRLLMEDEYFKGDSYFYVDDSVIYIQAKLDEKSFKDKIVKLNKEIDVKFEQAGKEDGSIKNHIEADYLAFQDKICYKIKFHEEKKSVFTHIDEADNLYGPISNITRETSLHSKLDCNLDEIDDNVSLKKLEALDQVISREIDEITQKQKDGLNNGKNGDILASRLKLLKRFKKYFLYRNRLLKIRETGGPNDEMRDDFEKRFLTKADNAEDFFEQFEEDIFQSEYRLLIQKSTREDAEGIKEKVCNFESDILVNNGITTEDKCDSLFYTKDVETACLMKSMSQDSYTTLVRWARENFSGIKSVDPKQQMGKFRDFLMSDESSYGIKNMRKEGFRRSPCTKFVMNASPEYQRRILNVFFSEIIGVTSSDALSFTKINSRRLRYAELRILAFLRNRNFNISQFQEFVEHLNGTDIPERMGIDMGILEVLNIFIRNVKNPEWVDSLIVTHRLTKGLWYNGSKFLNSYTLHNEEHAVTLITKSLELTNRIDYFVLKDVDFYILFLACYLHDISMVIHPDMGRLSSENGNNLILISELMKRMKAEVDHFDNVDFEDKKNSRYKNAGRFLISVFEEVYNYFEVLVRDSHAKDSARFIRERSDSLLNYLEPTLLSFVAKVSESHGYDVLDVYGLKSRAKDDTASLKYLMILIRLADLLDVANDRVNYHLLKQNLKNLSSTSKFHWISHLVTDRIELNTDYTTDDKVGLGDKPITEVINLNLFLNFKQLTVASQKMKCEGCLMEKVKDEDCLTVRITGGGDNPYTCPEKDCPILCYWMMKKHNWLIKELIALNDYLFSVNNSLFKTEINFNIRYQDDMRLDADLFDSVQEYLESVNQPVN